MEYKIDVSKRPVPSDSWQHLRNYLFTESNALTVGRNPGNDIEVDNPHVSREHGRFRIDGARVLYEDLETSSNGSDIYDRNDELREHLRRTEVLLEPGDYIRLGGGEDQFEWRLRPEKYDSESDPQSDPAPGDMLRLSDVAEQKPKNGK